MLYTLVYTLRKTTDICNIILYFLLFFLKKNKKSLTRKLINECAARVYQILDDIDKIIKYTNNVSYDDFMDDEQLIDAVLFRLIQMTENIKKLSIMFKEQHASVSWNDIVGFRNRIVHDYGKTDYTIVYEVVSNDIPNLKETLLKIN
jgi:uncharacterized protein with HEPN domain